MSDFMHKEFPAGGFESLVDEVHFLSGDLVCIKIKSKLLSSNYITGQFFKLQNYKSSLVPRFEPIALAASGVHGDILSFHIKILGESTKRASMLPQGERVSLLGPLGEGYKTHAQSKYLLIAEEVSGFMFAEYAKKLNANDAFAKIVIFVSEESLNLYRNNLSIDGDPSIFAVDFSIMACLLQNSWDYIYVSGSSIFLDHIEKLLRETQAKKYFTANNLMQCMMGGVCGQCMFVNSDGDIEFTCQNQLQSLSQKAVSNLGRRLMQNRALEKLN